jgi:hypothetical protein
MKDKEVEISSREKEVVKNESMVKKCKLCNTQLNSIKVNIDKIKNILTEFETT